MEKFSLVSNNCIGADILHQLRMQYQSPTVNLQILPEEYPKFCKNIEHYMNTELIEYKREYISPKHILYLTNMFGHVPNMPYALCDDIIICFQHYDTFLEGKIQWDKRKERFDSLYAAYIFYVRSKDYKHCLDEFVKLNLPNSLVFTEDFNVNIPIEYYSVSFPPGWHFLNEDSNGVKYYQRRFDPAKWVEKVRASWTENKIKG